MTIPHGFADSIRVKQKARSDGLPWSCARNSIHRGANAAIDQAARPRANPTGGGVPIWGPLRLDHVKVATDMHGINGSRLGIEHRISLNRVEVPNRIEVADLGESKLVRVGAKVVTRGCIDLPCI